MSTVSAKILDVIRENPNVPRSDGKAEVARRLTPQERKEVEAICFDAGLDVFWTRTVRGTHKVKAKDGTTRTLQNAIRGSKGWVIPEQSDSEDREQYIKRKRRNLYSCARKLATTLDDDDWLNAHQGEFDF